MHYQLIIGWLLDLIFGDPERLPHPVVYMGKWISFWEHRLNKGCYRKLKGAILSLLSIIGLFTATWTLFHAIDKYCDAAWATWVSVGVQAVIVFFCLAGKTLRKEVGDVFKAVDRSIDEGRTQVARIVGRDTSDLTPQEIRTAALETLAENLSDGIIAPLFWFAVLGVPGMLTYKLINTFDSMIGYHSERYKDFGCWAARIDDIANYIPARITALLMTIIGSCYIHANPLKQLAFVFKYGPQHASPNSGWPEAALAGLLDCRFGGPHNYFGQYFYKPYIGHNPRLFNTNDMKRSIRICLWSEVWFIMICIGKEIMMNLI